MLLPNTFADKSQVEVKVRCLSLALFGQHSVVQQVHSQGCLSGVVATVLLAAKSFSDWLLCFSGAFGKASYAASARQR